MHTSIELPEPIEFINVVPVNPLISKCQIKVCYVGDEPNRNRSIITKETARQLANSLPGSPIVGFYNEETQDFEEHNRSFEIKDGKIVIKDTTRPYGFVDLNAKVWFQKFEDDGIVHEYLVTEGWLWTGQYPECQRVIDKGNNHSMELDDKNINAYWTKDNNGKPRFFIINEAIMSKLCILGINYEPCFEGSSITKVQYSLDEKSKNLFTDFICQMKEIIQKGGNTVKTYPVKVGDTAWVAVYSLMDAKGNPFTINGFFEEDSQKYAVVQSEEKYLRVNFSLNEANEITLADEIIDITENYTPTDCQFALADVEAFVEEYKKKDKDKEEEKVEDKKDEQEEDKNPKDEEEDKKKKKKYSLDEVEEYQTLLVNHNTLQTEFNTYKATAEKTINELNATINSLTEFKNSVERKEKEHMINVDFCMLDDELKKDVVANIDKYSLREIEAELSILCVRNKVNFNLDDDNKKQNDQPLVFGLNDDEDDQSMPAWVKAACETAKKLNK